MKKKTTVTRTTKGSREKPSGQARSSARAKETAKASKAARAAARMAKAKPASKAKPAVKATRSSARKPGPVARAARFANEKVLKVSLQAPDPEVVQWAAEVLTAGGVVAFPTDTLYALGAVLGNAAAAARITRLRGIDTGRRPFTLLLPDVGTLPHYAKVGESAYRIVNRIFPGPYCVELAAGPKVLGQPGFAGATLGLRIPASELCTKLLWRLGRPLVSATAKAPGGQTLTTADEIRAAFGDEVDLVLDGGPQTGLPSTVISLVDDWITILRAGRGSTANIL